MPVVIAAGSDSDLVVNDFVDESMLVRDASRPVSSKVILQWFGLSDAFVSIAHDVLDQGIDSLEHLTVLPLPPQVVLPGIGVPDESHA
jgi:hypothetical protein